MQLAFMPETQTRRGFPFPFRRRRSRLERLRHQAARRAQELRAAAPDAAQALAAARRVVAERAPDIDLQELLQERLPLDRLPLDRLPLDRVPGIAQRPRGMAGMRQREVPAWAVAAAALGGFMFGLGVGMWLTERRRAAGEPVRALDAAADEIKAAWPELTDDDIAQARGSVARLVKTIRERTGEDAAHVRERLESMTAESEVGSRKSEVGGD